MQTILLSPKFRCTEEILTIVSLLSVDSVLYNPPSRRDEVQGIRKKFISSEGDHITLLNIYRTFKNIGGNKVSLVLLIFSIRHVIYVHLPFWAESSKELRITPDVISETSASRVITREDAILSFDRVCVSLILNVGKFIKYLVNFLATS